MEFTYCYILYSPSSREFYISHTSDLRKEIKDHSEGKTYETRKGNPWNLVWYSAFRLEDQARDFVNYLKTNTGNSFMRLRLVSIKEVDIEKDEIKPASAKTCPICGGKGEAANDTAFYRGNRYSKNVTLCLTCMGKGWIDPSRKPRSPSD